MLQALSPWLVAMALVASAAHASAGESLLPPADGRGSLQGQLSLRAVNPYRGELPNTESELSKINSFSLMGDYYLSRPWLGSAGGLRATSGLLFGSRSSVWSSPSAVERRALATLNPDGSSDTATLPYLGIGYTGWSRTGSWGMSADLGLMAVNPRSATRLGKVVNGSQSLDDTVRDLRLSPLLQLGLSYSF